MATVTMTPRHTLKRNASDESDTTQVAVPIGADKDVDIDSLESQTFGVSRFSKAREWIREPAAEFVGTMLLVLFGAGTNAQVAMAGAHAGDWLAVSFGWACGIALGVCVSGGISGGHINPAVTLAMAIFRGFSWKKVPAFVLAQILGGISGAALVYANFRDAISLFEGGPSVRTITGSRSTAGFFGAYAAEYVSDGTAFFNEALMTAILMFVILAVTDKKAQGGALPAYLVGLALFCTMLGIALCLGTTTGFAMNPARDFGPRLLTLMVGYGKGVFTYRNHYWLWCSWLAPITGALVAAFSYDLLLYTGEDGIFGRRQVLHKNGLFGFQAKSEHVHSF